MSDFSGKHVLISGGGSGVGAEICRQFAASGARVTILGRTQSALDAMAEQTDALPIACDVTDGEAVQNAVALAKGAHGPISICVANAGGASSQPFSRMTSNDLKAMLDLNVMGVFHLWQAVLGDMKTAGWGRLIAIASTAALKGYPYVSGYCAAKHAVLGLTRSLAVELARTGVTVNSICPGFVDTPMLERSLNTIAEATGTSVDSAAERLKAANPMGRFVDPGEVAAAALFLAQRSCSSVNGQAMSINGGEL